MSTKTDPDVYCRFGKKCSYYSPYYKQCGIHRFMKSHHDAVLFTVLMSVMIISIVTIVVVATAWSNEYTRVATEQLQYLNCGELASYIADYNEYYEEAEHRYEWLCVAEQIKEFQ